MTTLSWHCDDYGTMNLAPTVNGCQGHVWIQGRRPYCDRGHWEWGFEGLPMRPEDLPSPSYYFMRKERLREELEEWVLRATGNKTQGPGVSSIGAIAPMTAQAALPLGASWEKTSENTLETLIELADADPVRASVREIQSSTGPVFVFDVQGLEVDGSDRFPRAYLNLTRAMEEAEEFFAWRLLKTPAQTPGPLQDPDRPVGAALNAALVNDRPKRGRTARP